ncbi:hypothetical protein EDD18DRAFT_1361537 [Armillaria luteobubalina]|uniref:Uncharacterized protein n=1 Tax=Armillaria luteobubalina TaxID=153913 RepID=A0AA39UIM9_9AGAR|nr:hypothetical protein EDD18DRAFT_1361537 [Armillaria luteobubalina]
MNPTLLKHGYLVMTKGNMAIIKGWANLTRSFENVMGLILQCVEYNISFKLAVSRCCLPFFLWEKEAHLPAEILATGVPFCPGFLEPRLNDAWGSETLCTQYFLGASGVARCLNAGAAVTCGDVLGWITRKLIGTVGVWKLLDGPSYIVANLKHVTILSASNLNGNKFMAEAITMEEEKVLVGFIPSSDCRKSRSLLPMVYIVCRFLKGEAQAWMPRAEALMCKQWDEVLQGEAFALTMDEWEAYIAEFQTSVDLVDAYTYLAKDMQYGVDLFNITYPVDWTFIKLDSIIIPEVF